MPDLLLELFSEEIPARMQRRAAEDLRKLVTDALVEAGLVYEGARAFATPRRLALTVHGLPARSPDRREERKGPRVGAPEKAIDGFLKAAGLASIDQAKVQEDKKGDFYVAVIERPGRLAPEVIAEIVPQIVRSFPWPKSMRWGSPPTIDDSSGKPILDSKGEPLHAAGWLRWVRPLHSILCVFGPETEDTEIVDFEVGGIRSGNITYGHRFMAPGPIAVRRFEDYVAKLERAKVVLDADRRKDIIRADARDRALALGLELVEDEGLLEEVAGLVEWPVVLAGEFEKEFLFLPPEVIRTTIRANQKCFVLRRSASFEAPLRGAPQDEEVGSQGQHLGAGNHQPPHPEVRPRPQAGGASKDAPSNDLSNRFILVANIEAPDGGKTIVAGNGRVIRARLSDAQHFWETDLSPLPEYRDSDDSPLDQRLRKLRSQNIVFHEKLGTQGERIDRIARLAREIAPLVGADADKSERAAKLAKADLVTEMVGEFPELQGLMGKYYAEEWGQEDPSVATAIEDHYKPVGPSDRVPTDPVAIAVALADKLDMLVGFWAIDEKPTGSKDPYALRRAALGVIRIVLENGLRLPLMPPIEQALSWHLARLTNADFSIVLSAIRAFSQLGLDIGKGVISEAIGEATEAYVANSNAEIQVAFKSTVPETLAFFADRLKVQLREQGARHDLVDAVFALGSQDDLLLIVRRVEALGKFLDTGDGKNLLAGTKRATNILREEEKKSGERYDGAVDPHLLAEPEERALFEAVGAATGAARAAVELEDFDGAMRALAALRPAVDAFFGKVLVNAPDAGVRANRLRLLNRIREATLAVADFSRVEG